MTWLRASRYSARTSDPSPRPSPPRGEGVEVTRLAAPVPVVPAAPACVTPSPLGPPGPWGGGGGAVTGRPLRPPPPPPPPKGGGGKNSPFGRPLSGWSPPLPPALLPLPLGERAGVRGRRGSRPALARADPAA